MLPKVSLSLQLIIWHGFYCNGRIGNWDIITVYWMWCFNGLFLVRLFQIIYFYNSISTSICFVNYICIYVMYLFSILFFTWVIDFLSSVSTDTQSSQGKLNKNDTYTHNQKETDEISGIHKWRKKSLENFIHRGHIEWKRDSEKPQTVCVNRWQNWGWIDWLIDLCFMTYQIFMG